MQPTATPGNVCVRIVAPEGAGWSPVGHALAYLQVSQVEDIAVPQAGADAHKLLGFGVCNANG